MAVPSYTTDLATVDLAEGSAWTILTATGWTAGSAPVVNETDFFIQGTMCVSKQVKTGVGGVITPAVSNFTVPTDGAVLMWIKYDSQNSLYTEANGGIRTIIGNSNTVFYAWKQLGSDTYVYGGWVCLATNDTVTPDYTLGSPSSPWQRAGMASNPISVPSKGNTLGVDACRVGRCEARFANGSLADGYATFAGFATQNDIANNRWGLIQSVEGGYKWQGAMILGYTNPVTMVDQNVNIVVANTKKVTANFNTIEVRQATSSISWTNIAISALGTVSPGRWVTTDNATVNLTSCNFTDMGAFGFLANATITSTTFRRCGAITLSNSHFTSCLVTASSVAANTSAVIWNNNLDPNGYLDNTKFEKGATDNHAIEFGTSSPTTMTLTGVSFTGYSASSNTNSSAIHVKRTSGSVTIYCAAMPSVSSEGATVTVVGASVSATIKCLDVAGANVADVRVLAIAGAGGPFPSNVTVTIVNTGTSANVAHTAHGMATNDMVQIKGASLWQNNGVFQITKINDNYYNYTLPSAPGSSPTGTIKATFAVLSGNTDATGVITMSRVFPSDQPITGRARKSTAAPYYQTSIISGTVDSDTGYNATVLMIADQ